MGFGLIAAAGCLCCLAAVVFEAARRERAAARAWDPAATPKGERTYTALECRVRDMAQLVDVTLARAALLHRSGPLDEAQRVLAVAQRLLAAFVADMLGLHAGMAEFSRSAPAMTGVPGVPARRLRISPLAWRAHLCNLVRPFLVTADERFRLRLLTLRSGLLLLNGVVAREHERLRRRESAHLAADWRALEAARADLETLTGEALDSLRLLLAALAAQPRVPARVLGASAGATRQVNPVAPPDQ